MKAKRASFDLVSKETISLMLGAAAAAVMIMLVANLLTTNFDIEEETAKSYLETVHKQLQIADNGEIGTFRFFELGGERKEYYLVYFGDVYVRRPLEIFKPKNGFVLKQNLEHAFCVCFVEGDKGICNQCSASKHPWNMKEPFGIGNGDAFIMSQKIPAEGVHITRDGGTYIFEEIRDEV